MKVLTAEVALKHVKDLEYLIICVRAVQKSNIPVIVGGHGRQRRAFAFVSDLFLKLRLEPVCSVLPNLVLRVFLLLFKAAGIRVSEVLGFL